MKMADPEEWRRKRSYLMDDSGIIVEPRQISYLGWPEHKDIGNLDIEFEAWEPDPAYPWEARKPARVPDWPIVKAVKAPPVKAELPEGIIKQMAKAAWDFAEPDARVQRGSAGVDTRAASGSSKRTKPYADMRIGTRGVEQDQFMLFVQPSRLGYAPQQRPTDQVLTTHTPITTAIASDWVMFNSTNIKRVNAVTFRADKRSPHAVITAAGGFFPPNTRTDRPYITRDLALGFKGYIHQRYGGRVVDQNDIIRVIDKRLRDTVVEYEPMSTDDKELLHEYMVWLSILSNESSHLGRMTENELHKAYISTTICLDRSMSFAVMGHTPGWVYITVVHSGFVVPFTMGNINWGTQEAEIAQYGPVPSDRIVGFVRFHNMLRGENVSGPDTPIFIRKSFRRDEPKAFRAIYRALSGAKSTAVDD